jgi:tetratricopeptide (TPR) repeat protein
MFRASIYPALFAVILMSFNISVGRAQGGETAELPDIFSEPLPLYAKALGTFTRPISSTNPETQAYFDQGYQMMYAFAKEDAVRSFRESWKRDPDCAICYWGEAWAWGSYLNGPMGTSEAPHAYTAVRKALELAGDHADPKEQELIEAMSHRYVEDFDSERRLEQEQAYAAAMRPLYEKYSEDLDIATHYADALFLLEPRRGTRDLNDPDVVRLHTVLEGILATNIRHPGACHLYIHATESTTDPGKAEACSEYIGNSIPGASHINHMPSHTWNEIGRWGDSVRANIQAWHSDLKAPIGEGFAIYPQHNLHMLLFAASMDGQGAIAIQAGRDYTKLMKTNMYHVLTLVRFGRFDEVLEITERPEAAIDAGMWDFAQGYARLRTDEIDFARAHLNRVIEGAQSDAVFRRHSAEHLLGTVAGILEGEIHRAQGDLDAAIAAFRRAVVAEDALQYDEPEPMPFAARHWLGAALLEEGNYPDAERIYREELENHPHNGWSLFGLKAALEGQGRTLPEVDADFEASWARSDTWITGSRF